MHKLVVGMGGSSGSIYAKVLLNRLAELRAGGLALEVGVVMSDNAKFNWEYELGDRSYESYNFRLYDKRDFMAPFASGSARYEAMIVCPCSMGMLGRMAAGISDDLLGRAADVMLKERRRLILVPRDTPYSLVHLHNMTLLTQAGAVICPACPSFYSRPQSLEAVAATVVERVLDLAGLPSSKAYRWGEEGED